MEDRLQQVLDDPNTARALIEAELAKRSLYEFMKMAWPILEPGREFTPGWPVEAIVEHLEACSAGEIPKLLITVPPGSSKSLTTRVFFPAWHWVRHPYHKFIGASYSHHLSERDSGKCRDLIIDSWYRLRYPHVEIDPERQSKSNFHSTKRGFMFATSVGGVTTGERCDFFIIDDPHNVTKADSEVDRAATLQWFNEAVPTRLNDLDKSCIIIIMQRVHEEDVAASAIEQGYEHLFIPMHYDPEKAKVTSIGWKDPRKDDGELMWPARFSKQAIDRVAEQIGPYAAAAQLEQNPVPRQGGAFHPDNIKLIEKISDVVPDDAIIHWIRAWDLAASEGKGAYSVGLKMGAFKARPSDYHHKYIITDVIRKRLSAMGVKHLMHQTAIRDTPDCPIVFPQDPGQAGKDQAKDIVDILQGFDVKKEIQSGDKTVRASPFASQVESGNFYCLNHFWAKPLLEELRFFPKGKYKDQVDAGSSAFNELNRRLRMEGTSEMRLAGETQSNWARYNG